MSNKKDAQEKMVEIYKTIQTKYIVGDAVRARYEDTSLNTFRARFTQPLSVMENDFWDLIKDYKEITGLQNSKEYQDFEKDQVSTSLHNRGAKGYEKYVPLNLERPLTMKESIEQMGNGSYGSFRAFEKIGAELISKDEDKNNSPEHFNQRIIVPLKKLIEAKKNFKLYEDEARIEFERNHQNKNTDKMWDAELKNPDSEYNKKLKSTDVYKKYIAAAKESFDLAAKYMEEHSANAWSKKGRVRYAFAESLVGAIGADAHTHDKNLTEYLFNGKEIQFHNAEEIVENPEQKERLSANDLFREENPDKGNNVKKTVNDPAKKNDMTFGKGK